MAVVEFLVEIVLVHLDPWSKVGPFWVLCAEALGSHLDRVFYLFITEEYIILFFYTEHLRNVWLFTSKIGNKIKQHNNKKSLPPLVKKLQKSVLKYKHVQVQSHIAIYKAWKPVKCCLHHVCIRMRWADSKSETFYREIASTIQGTKKWTCSQHICQLHLHWLPCLPILYCMLRFLIVQNNYQ